MKRLSASYVRVVAAAQIRATCLRPPQGKLSGNLNTSWNHIVSWRFSKKSNKTQKVSYKSCQPAQPTNHFIPSSRPNIDTNETQCAASAGNGGMKRCAYFA